MKDIRHEGLAEVEIRKCVRALQKEDIPLHHIGAFLVLSGSMFIGTAVPGLRPHFMEAFEISTQILEQLDGSEADQPSDSAEAVADHGEDRTGTGEGAG